MQLFTNNTRTRFFTTDNHVKNLELIEVSSVLDVVEQYSICDPLVLVDILQLYTNDLDQLKTMKSNHEVDSIVFDFLKDLSYAEITKQILDIYDYPSQLSIIEAIESEWLCDTSYQADIDTLALKPTDGSRITVTINHETDEITYAVDSE